MPKRAWETLKSLSFLIGRWRGQAEGFGQTSDVEHVYRWVLGDNFIHGRTRSTPRGSQGADVHEDWTFFSYDPERRAVVLRGFYSEGYVNEYELAAGGASGGELVFTSVRTEGAGGMSARLRVRVISDERYEMFLDLAMPGAEFKTCQTIKMERAAD